MSRTSSRLANDAWESLLTAHAALMKQFAAEDVWHGLTMREYDVLYTLSKCPEPIRPAELNRHVLLTQPALSRMVDRLVERGFVQRTRDPHDGRGSGSPSPPRAGPGSAGWVAGTRSAWHGR
ncbi:MarR family winged helix-turn-helix transcriptional regulator [Nocardia carnea]|uniref:MarR family winged helix-turn-helix transcriptional regulator n=1 Tax=Nocardia carnea TaxID=37328 RepID=A0ABW7TI73_9NOCA|nr:MarR family transcriptional regulator [Nocardia carnea]